MPLSRRAPVGLRLHCSVITIIIIIITIIIAIIITIIIIIIITITIAICICPTSDRVLPSVRHVTRSIPCKCGGDPVVRCAIVH